MECCTVTTMTKRSRLWDKRDLLVIGLAISIFGIMLGFGLHKTTTLLISDSVFNGLLVMISIFIAYVSVIVVFYLGKMDEHEREFLHALNNVRISEEELFTSYINYIQNLFQGNIRRE